ncbi:MAG: hypothetical protein CML68_16315 [Rhodobacteraceae bacterium]|nr:hypothetical protein [Paracoccaceae bacterium]
MTLTPDTNRLALVADLLIPGRAPDWPAASTVLDGVALARALAPVTALASDLAQMPADARLAALKACERDESVRFGAALDALSDAYYATPEVARRCAALADAGPKPASGQFFDPRLVDGVRARAARG